MTATATRGADRPATHPVSPARDRLVTAVRLQLLVWPSSMALAWAILIMSFLANLAVWGSIGGDELADAWTGGLVSLYAVTFTSYVVTLTQVFPLLVGLGLTRKLFHQALTILSLVQAGLYALVLEGLATVEAATNGWGVSLAFFRPGPLAELDLPARLVCYGVPFLLLAHVGIVLGVTHRRWGANGIFALVGGVFVSILALLATLALGGVLDDTLGWIGDQSFLRWLALWPLPVVGTLAAAGRAGIARATP